MNIDRFLEKVAIAAELAVLASSVWVLICAVGMFNAARGISAASLEMRKAADDLKAAIEVWEKEGAK